MWAISQKTLSKVIAYPSLYLTKVIILYCIAKGRTKVHMKMIFYRNIGKQSLRIIRIRMTWKSIPACLQGSYQLLIKTIFFCATKRKRDTKSTTEKWFHSPKNKVNVTKFILTISSCRLNQLEGFRMYLQLFKDWNRKVSKLCQSFSGDSPVFSYNTWK